MVMSYSTCLQYNLIVKCIEVRNITCFVRPSQWQEISSQEAHIILCLIPTVMIQIVFVNLSKRDDSDLLSLHLQELCEHILHMKMLAKQK